MNDLSHAASTSEAAGPSWKQVVARYQKPSTGHGVWQILNTVVPYLLLWCLMAYTATVSWWITIPLAVLAGGLDRKSTRLNSSHIPLSRMPSSA